MPDVLVDHETEIDVLIEREVDVVLEQSEPEEIIITESSQGPRGIQGPQGPQGGTTPVQVGSIPLSGHSAAALSADGLLVPADCGDPAHLGAVVGVVDSAYPAGDMAVVRASLPLEHAGWTWTPGPVFVGLAGALTQTVPPGAVFIQVIGRAVSATRVLIDIQPPISIA